MKRTEDIEAEASKENERKNYTNLFPVYFAKLFSLLAIAIVTIALSNGELVTLAIGAFTLVVGICFDFLIIALSNNGPKKKIRLYLAWILWAVEFIAIWLFIILFIYLSDERELDDLWRNRIKQLINIFMIASAVLGPLLEMVNNRPKDD